MNIAHINNLANQYIITPDESIFNEIYLECMNDWAIKFPKIALSLHTDEWEVQALYEDKLMKCLRVFKGGNFVHFLRSSLKNARADYYEKKKLEISKYEDMEISHFEPKYGDFLNVFETNIALNQPSLFYENKNEVENGVFEKFYETRTKTSQEKQKLVHYLKSKCTDKETMLLIEALPKCKNMKHPYAELGKVFGIHPTTVMRKFKRLEKHFDPKKFGEKQSYLR